MHGINPLAEFQKVLSLMTDEPASAPAPAPAAPKPMTPGETKMAIASDLLRHRLTKAELEEANGKAPGRIADSLVAPLIQPTPAPKQNSADRHPITGNPVPPRMF